ncbi:MAG TPA: hypothetical protein VII97_13080 [Anaerolineales bacterium]
MKILLEMVELPIPMREFTASVEGTLFPTGSGGTEGQDPNQNITGY